MRRHSALLLKGIGCAPPIRRLTGARTRRTASSRVSSAGARSAVMAARTGQPFHLRAATTQATLVSSYATHVAASSTDMTSVDGVRAASR